MKFKLDENIGRRGIAFLRASGHDVSTVADQGLSGIGDRALFDVCAAEGRALITLDNDFGQVLRFPPAKSAGIVILGVRSRTSRQSILDRLAEFLAVLGTGSVSGALWIVEPGRVRIHLTDR